MTFVKDPDSVLPYVLNWADWLVEFVPTAKIISCVAAPDTGLTVLSTSHGDDTVTVVVSGGTVDRIYNVRVRVTLDQGPPYVADRTIQFRIQQL